MDQERRLGDGRYAIGGLLGRGGMAEVHLAEDLKLGRTVAVKTLRPDLAGDPACRARFLREARSAASLNHPGIVAVYDTGEDRTAEADLPYIVMEYVQGRTLAEVARADPAPTARQALRHTAGVLDALAHAHRSGIVHRDIKPANVMLCPDGTVKVMDFGIARSLGAQGMTLTRTAMVIGTAEYLSPEQARGEEVDARTDLYSIGCLLYELLTGQPPFTGDNPMAVAHAQVSAAPELPSRRAPGLPPVCDTLVLRALAQDRAERYQDAEEMRAAVEDALRRIDAPAAVRTPTLVSDPVPPPAPHHTADAPREPRRGYRRGSRRVWTVTAALAALLTAVGGYAVTVSGDGSGRRQPASAVSVPDLVGKSLPEARDGAQTVGLRVVRVGSGLCERRAARRVRTVTQRVCGQIPSSGRLVAPGTGIRVQLSSAPPVP